MAAATRLEAALARVGVAWSLRGGLCKSEARNFDFISATCTWINIHKYPVRQQAQETAREEQQRQQGNKKPGNRKMENVNCCLVSCELRRTQVESARTGNRSGNGNRNANASVRSPSLPQPQYLRLSVEVFRFLGNSFVLKMC